ncbi:hypothetical protein MKX03_036024, partial [Papaver bracteatum]
DISDKKVVETSDHFIPVPEEMYNGFWRTHSVGDLRTATTHINTRDNIGVGHIGLPQ